MTEKKITITRNGPYEVSGGIPLDQAVIGVNEKGDSEVWNQGRDYQPQDEPYHLCRCGHSANKPYCDGAHEKRGFKGREKAGRPPYTEHAELQRGPALGLLDDESLCVGARFCDRAGSVWNLVDQSDDPAKRELAIEEASRCPAGRLTIVDEEGYLLEPELEAGISLVQDPAKGWRGPLWVKGRLPVEGAGGEKYEARNRVALCRCGESSNMPYCDGAHYSCSHMKGLDK